MNEILRELKRYRRFQNPGTPRMGWGSDPCQDFSGEFEQSFARILNNICQDFGIRALYPLSRVAFTHFFSSNLPVCQDWGKGWGGQANPGNARILSACDTVTPP